jgi:hypothetical protein
MGESGPVWVAPGIGDVKPSFEDRGLKFSHEKEISTASYYTVELQTKEGPVIIAEQSASKVSHVGN